MTSNQLLLTIIDQKGRIDKVLHEAFPQYTRSQLQHWLKQELVQVNECVVKANYKVKSTDQIIVNIPAVEELVLKKQDLHLEIVYEDEALLVVNKPSGMVAHPSKGHSENTLVNGLLYHVESLKNAGGESFRPGLVHRIDKDTSGLLVVAKTPAAHAQLSEQLVSHTMERTYIALVEGVIEENSGTIDAPLARNPHNRLKRMVAQDGRRAVTHFTVEERLENATFIRLQLETGRTHQIRVHMSYIHHPILNDPMYHPKGQTEDSFGQYLHALTVGFIHPCSGDKLTFTSELPAPFVAKLQSLRRSEV